MRKRHSYIYFAAAALMLTTTSCERTQDSQPMWSINYQPVLGGMESADTRGTLYNPTNTSTIALSTTGISSFTVFGYKGSTMFTNTGGETVGYTSSWTPGTGGHTEVEPEKDTYTFLAYANGNDNVSSLSSTYEKISFSYDMKKSGYDILDATRQKDVLLGYFSKEIKSGPIEAGILFKHPLTSVIFRLGIINGDYEKDDITRIEIRGVHTSGTATLTSGGTVSWTSLSPAPAETPAYLTDVTYCNKPSSGDFADSDYVIGEPFILLPQDLSKYPVKIRLCNNNDYTSYKEATLSTGSWEPGKTYIYSLTGSEGMTVYLDAAEWIPGGGDATFK